MLLSAPLIIVGISFLLGLLAMNAIAQGDKVIEKKVLKK